MPGFNVSDSLLPATISKLPIRGIINSWWKTHGGTARRLSTIRDFSRRRIPLKQVEDNNFGFPLWAYVARV